VKSDDKHLSDEQIELALAHERADTEGRELRDLDEHVRGHLTGCEICQQMIQMHHKFEGSLRGLHSTYAGIPAKDCPPIESLRALVVGLKSVQESEKLLDHTAHCDYCALLLRDAVVELTSEPTSDEVSFLAQLSSAQPSFQRELARKLVAAPSPETVRESRISSFGLPKSASSLLKIRRPFYAAIAALFIAALIVSWVTRVLRGPSVDQLIAQSYSERRTLELRLAEAQLAPIRQQRGSGGSSFSKPAALLEAELQIKLQLQKTPDDPKWLALKGRSELLEWQYADAILSFERALEVKPDSPDLLRDLATAHFERAEAEQRPIDYGSAIEELSKALAKRPNDPVCLFNRAIIYERMFLYENAMKDWESYLTIDPGGSWSAEARAHLEGIRKSLQKHNQSQELLIEDPVTAANHFDKTLETEFVSHNETSAIDEQYLDLASDRWLAGLADDLRNRRSVRKSPYGEALRSFSEFWRIRHADPWLSDLMKSADVQGFPDAAEALSDAVRAASNGDPSLARSKAELAAQLFERLPNRAGTLRAKLEGVYALQRLLEGETCLKTARVLDTELDGLPYYWLHAKLLLEESACAASAARIEDAERYVRRAEEIASQREFGGLHLRGLSFASDFAADKGDRNTAWKDARLGLEQFWGGSFPAIRGYALCASLGYLAEDSQEAWTAIAFWSEAVPLIERTTNRSTEGLALYRLATDEVAVGSKSAADTELKRVRQIFFSLPDTAASLNYRVASEVSLAAVEFSLGDTASAKRRLRQVGPFVSNVHQYQTALQYYGTKAEEQILDNDLSAAERSLRSAVAISRQGSIDLGNDADRLNWDDQTSATYRSLVHLLLSEPGREHEALRVWESYRSLPFRATKARALTAEDTLARIGAKPPKPDEADVNVLLPFLKDVTFVTYAQLEDGIALWMYDDRGIEFHRISAPIEQVSAVSSQFVRLCSDPNSDMQLLQSDAKQLYKWLIDPVRPHLSPKRTIWLEPDGILSLVPFQALVDLDGNPLLNKFEVAYRTATTRQYWAQETSVVSSDALVIADSSLLVPHTSSGLPPLPDAVKETQAIVALFPNHSLILSEDSKPQEMRAALRRAAVFHYAGHYVPTREVDLSPLGSMLRSDLSGNPKSTVRSRFIFSRCKLAVLSACSTGAAEKLGLFDTDGLVRPLLASGARRVIASRWYIDSSVTRMLMADFYSELLSGETSVDALQTASRKVYMRASYVHPYYWAGFCVFGQN
jgi:CHAT domain-containing protein/tetratricopeptide (TPR) repeat protein